MATVNTVNASASTPTAVLEDKMADLGVKDKGYFHAHWVDVRQITPEIAASVVKDVRLDYAEIVADAEETILTLTYNGIEYLSAITACAFLNKVRGPSFEEEARSDLSTAFGLVSKARENGQIYDEHLNGVTFVLTQLREYINGKLVSENSAASAAIEKGFNRLSRRSQAAIWAMKDYFIEILPGKFWKLAADDAGARGGPSKMVELDPDCSEWHLRLYRQRWHKYRNPGTWSEKKSRLRLVKAAIEGAVELDPDHPNVLLYHSECLMELGKHVQRKNGAWVEFVKCAGQKFGNAEELEDCVLEMQRKLLEICPTVRNRLKIVMSSCIRSNSGQNTSRSAAQITIAKNCLEDAYMQHPKSPKVNHKLGLFALVIDKNLARATAHFRRARELGPNHFFVLVDLITVLMGNPTENQAEIFRLISKNVGVVDISVPWSQEQKNELTQLKGTTKFMLGEYKEAIRLWIQVWDGGRSFQNLRFKIDRYQWPEAKISLDLIQREVGNALAQNLREPGTWNISEVAVLQQMAGKLIGRGWVKFGRGRGARGSTAGLGAGVAAIIAAITAVPAPSPTTTAAAAEEPSIEVNPVTFSRLVTVTNSRAMPRDNPGFQE